MSKHVQSPIARRTRHRSQRFNSPSRGPSAILHWNIISLFRIRVSLLLVLHVRYGYIWRQPEKGRVATHLLVSNDAWGWHMQFLTIIALTLTMVVFGTALVADLTASTRLFTVKNIMTMACAPLEVLVSILYWGLKSIDESLVLPPNVPRLSTLDDLSFHAWPAILLSLDLLLFSPPSSATARTAILTSASIATAYWFWVEAVHAHNGVRPYPIFDELGTAGRIGLFVLSAGIMAASSVVLGWLYGFVNGVVRERCRGNGGEFEPRIGGTQG